MMCGVLCSGGVYDSKAAARQPAVYVHHLELVHV